MEWLQEGGIEELRTAGIDSAILDSLEGALLGSEDSDRSWRLSPLTIRLPVSTTSAKFEAGTRLLIRRSPDSAADEFDVFTLHVQSIGTFAMDSPTPTLWKMLETPELINALVESIDVAVDGHTAVVRLQMV